MNERQFVKMLIQRLNIEKEKTDRSGVYGYTQRTLAYNSNKIEGSTLTEKQTFALFDTGVVYQNGIEGIYGKDIEEATGHFSMFNYMLKTLDEPLSEKLIKELHYMLKKDVFEDLANGYPVGEYKNRANRVSNVVTAKPLEVEEQLSKLIEEYNSLSDLSLMDISKFHGDYEKIHPFQDGNGRTGRIIMFRECLRNNITPFIVLDNHKHHYYEALNKYQTEGDITSLIQYFELEQEKYSSEIKSMVVPCSEVSDRQ